MIQWETREGTRLPVKSWCKDIDEGTLTQARNLANHPVIVGHVALMPDAHVGYGMPIGGVIACEGAVIPNAVGVDIGCGMGAIQTNARAEELGDRKALRLLIEEIKTRIPVGEGKARSREVEWPGFEAWLDGLGGAETPGWHTQRGLHLDACNLGTLGGGNHFIEIQRSESGSVWLMLHSGSRNLGYRIAAHYHKEALKLNGAMGISLPDPELAFLPLDDELGIAYVRDMRFALAYAAENRRIMMEHVKRVMEDRVPGIEFLSEVNIHHNYAAEETHAGKSVWVHRKGATSARLGETGIIPGSMGTSSYIVEGLGSPESFESCSHGAGRRMGRAAACRLLSEDECDKAMEGVVFDRWGTSDMRGAGRKKLLDLSEAPLAYKDIDAVIEAELDLIKPVVKLGPMAVVKG
jgi:tRNA-splicing ligase RtcB